jgi:hypothetical protein
MRTKIDGDRGDRFDFKTGDLCKFFPPLTASSIAASMDSNIETLSTAADGRVGERNGDTVAERAAGGDDARVRSTEE